MEPKALSYKQIINTLNVQTEESLAQHIDADNRQKTPFLSGSETVAKTTATNVNLSEMSIKELQEYTNSLKHPKLVDFCIELVKDVRRLKQQAELRDELLKRSQKQAEGRDKTIAEKDSQIEKLMKDLKTTDKEVLEKENANSELTDESTLFIEGGT